MGYFHRFLEQISYENTELHFLAAHGIFDQSAYPQDYMRQRLLNDSYLLHVNKIQQAFVNHSIPHYFFKGVTLLYDVYPSQQQRQCSDIDFFVSDKFLTNAIDILGELGFTYNSTPLSHHCMDQYFHSSATHLSPFYHCTTKVMLELHTLPVYCSCEDYALELHTVANSFIYNDCRTLVLGNRSIQTFTISKTFFLLLLHLARHIACDVAYCVMEPESVIHIPVKTLVDCYYFNLKYSKEIEWLEIER